MQIQKKISSKTFFHCKWERVKCEKNENEEKISASMNLINFWKKRQISQPDISFIIDVWIDVFYMSCSLLACQFAYDQWKWSQNPQAKYLFLTR